MKKLHILEDLREPGVILDLEKQGQVIIVIGDREEPMIVVVPIEFYRRLKGVRHGGL